MKKILFIHHAVGWGGAPQNMINIINSLPVSGYKISVLLLKDSIVRDKLKENGIDYYIASSWFYKQIYKYYSNTIAGHIKWYSLRRQFVCWLSWLLSHYIFATRELKNFEFDIVHLNSSVLTDWLKPCSIRGKVVMHVQEPLAIGYFGIRHWYFTNQMSKFADRIIVISEDNAERLGIPEKIDLIYNYSNVPIEPPSHDSYSSKKVLYLGGDADIKGFYTIVAALDYLNNNVKVYFGGSYISEKDDMNILNKVLRMVFRIRNKKLMATRIMRNHPNAIEIGMTNQVNKYLNEVCCLISPFSVSHFSRPVIEAFLHKKPAIGSDVVGMDEIIKNGKTGLIVPRDNPKALAEAINRLVSDSEKALEFGERGYREAVQKYSPKNILLFQKVYEKL